MFCLSFGVLKMETGPHPYPIALPLSYTLKPQVLFLNQCPWKSKYTLQTKSLIQKLEKMVTSICLSVESLMVPNFISYGSTAIYTCQNEIQSLPYSVRCILLVIAQCLICRHKVDTPVLCLTFHNVAHML
jgi:hypothetical protein